MRNVLGPRRTRRRGDPAIFVERTVPQHLEVLDMTRAHGLGTIKGVYPALTSTGWDRCADRRQLAASQHRRPPEMRSFFTEGDPGSLELLFDERVAVE